MKFKVFLFVALVTLSSACGHRFRNFGDGITDKQYADAAAALEAHGDTDDYCAFTNKYTAKERLKLYPFLKATKVLAVSYEPPVMEETVINSDLKAEIKVPSKPSGLIVKDGVLDYSTLIEIKELNAAQIDSLTNLLFNTDFKVKGLNSFSEGNCFEPRNSFVFFNLAGKVFDYLQICFECLNSRSKTDKISVGKLCAQKYDLLRAYMIGLGIKSGTEKMELEEELHNTNDEN
jgi:hypothetical protein